jgi:hypothetical protein
MMKHPKFRCRDILYMDKVSRKELFDFVWTEVSKLPISKDMVDIELVGSLAFGCNGLSSDVDFNIAFADWNAQVPARRWFYGEKNRAGLVDACLKFQKQWGLKIDIGCVDCESEQYNVFASTKKMLLYNRGKTNIPSYYARYPSHSVRAY